MAPVTVVMVSSSNVKYHRSTSFSRSTTHAINITPALYRLAPSLEVRRVGVFVVCHASPIRNPAACSAASRSSFSSTWAYVSRKKPTLAWPMRSLMTFGLTPARRAPVAHE